MILLPVVAMAVAAFTGEWMSAIFFLLSTWFLYSVVSEVPKTPKKRTWIRMPGMLLVRGLISNERARTKMTYEAFQDKMSPFDWRVEATNEEGDGEVYVAIFTGPNARSRAEEYAEWKDHA